MSLEQQRFFNFIPLTSSEQAETTAFGFVDATVP